MQEYVWGGAGSDNVDYAVCTRETRRQEGTPPYSAEMDDEEECSKLWINHLKWPVCYVDLAACRGPQTHSGNWKLEEGEGKKKAYNTRHPCYVEPDIRAINVHRCCNCWTLGEGSKEEKSWQIFPTAIGKFLFLSMFIFFLFCSSYLTVMAKDPQEYSYIYLYFLFPTICSLAEDSFISTPL